ncbi:exocyst complex component 6B-like isoform X2 [Branchiostoma lanceolatum]|uniref:exocyst complex component 6B-like isoform X2 n=1 Tax=Branchiostoma lanceolatum TaxID=7740 RepID=UPI003457383E
MIWPFVRDLFSFYATMSCASNRRVTDSAELRTEHERILKEIESSEPGLVGGILRAVYDNEGHETFLEKLNTRIRSHDRDIERMCNHHYQGFIDSITELLKVRSEAVKLQSLVTESNAALQESSKELVKKSEELLQCRRIQKNITSATESLSLCLPVLEMYIKLKEQMDQKRYYPALKTLEQLEHTYLPRVSRYRFSKIMADAIPRLRESIKDASMSDLKDFLESIRKHSERIGEHAMSHALKQKDLDRVLVRKYLMKKSGNKKVQEEKKDTEEETNPFGSEDGEEEDDDDDDDEDEDEERSAQDMIDFSPVYRCMHIYSVLGAREQFENYYRKQRRKQARLALQPQSNMHETLQGYKSYFHQIIGFFVVEDTVMNTTQGLVSRQFMDELWDMALSKIIAVLRTHSAYCTDATLMLEIKNLIVLFSDTLAGYGFPVSQLYDLLMEIRDQYNEILMKRWLQIFREILESDTCAPLYVTDKEEYSEIIRSFPYQDEALEKEDFPKRFPFSGSVPQVYKQIKEFAYACIKFSEDLNLSHTEIDDMVRKSTNLLLTRTLSGCLTSHIKKQTLGMAELVQISINTTHLETACVYLEDFISNMTGAVGDSVHTARLQGTNTFKDTRQEAESQIYTKLNTKIDEFLDLACYNWTLQEPRGHASGYLMDLIAFLQSTFAVFTNLPGKVAQTACMSACKHLASSLMTFLLDNEVRQVSMGALQQFNLDVIQCEQFVDSEPVPGFKDGALQMTFVELRQLLDLFMAWDWSLYLSDYGQERNKYVRVHPSTAITILEKMREADKKKNLFSLKKNERDRRKLLDAVLKQLRQLVNGGSNRIQE